MRLYSFWDGGGSQDCTAFDLVWGWEMSLHSLSGGVGSSDYTACWMGVGTETGGMKDQCPKFQVYFSIISDNVFISTCL